MPIDLNRNFIFVHIPRTGGTSIEEMFGLKEGSCLFGLAPYGGTIDAMASPQHLTWQQLIQILPTSFTDSAYKFAFVRNPWDRFLSAYRYRLRCYLHGLKRSGASYYKRCLYNESHLASLDSFVATLEFPIEHRVTAVGGLDAHLEPQCTFVTDAKGRIAMDRICRFENFEPDIRAVADGLGIQLGEIVRQNVTSGGTRYRSSYSTYAMDAVRAFYAEDIERFEYTF